MKNEHIEWVSLDDFISLLQEEKERLGGDGSVPVCINGLSAVWLDTLPYYYDGGYCALDVHDGRNIKSSRTRNDNGSLSKSVGFHDTRVDLRVISDDYDMRFGGRLLTEVDTDNWNWYDKLQQEERAIFGGQLVNYRVAKKRDDEWDCYPFTAYLASGEEAMGRCMKDAKDALMKVYSNNEPND